MKLLIIITGLVLLVPDRSNQRVHLLFPEVDMSHPGMEYHAPFLTYTATGGGQRVPLDGYSLDLGTVAQPGTALAIPREVIDLGGLFVQGVPRNWVTGVPSNRVQGRVSLPWPQRFVVEGSADWLRLVGTRLDSVVLTNRVVLEYDRVNQQPASWTLYSLPRNPAGNVSVPSLKPSGTGDDTIEIENVPASGGATLRRGDEGVHFQGYVDLLRMIGEHVRQRPRVYLNALPDTGLSPFNCMLATAPPRP